ncbi:sodium/proton antiporter NhaA [Helicobacter sp. MIT 21-1697]|uniref:sodium/proton antiporter NhaA n=1 Tax=Helicobacter sp. MIT 21-1697 TaxID=2993733 RepID=UPI00224B90E0|nr:sodium/proton antiporter NhaA [Helicobacter sp. MIT 21-1697]MCX2717237.1 sodium/proton antiporter NhaA [Helicobacter sp. MIT 21-1697]
MAAKQNRISEALSSFIRAESFSGIFLFFCAVSAMVVANSPLSDIYKEFWEQPFGFSFAGGFYGFSIHDWINDVLMSIFFLMVGLEIKRELLFGDLSGFQKAAFPVIGAIGGMIVPGVIYYAFNMNTPSYHGFGIPMATDIAFALGVILLLGKRVPLALKVFLVTLAVADDLGAIVVIAVFYPSPEGLHFVYLGAAVGILLFLTYINHLGVRHLGVYIGIGILLWFCVHHSGIHATIAAVALAFCIPVKPKIESKEFIQVVQQMIEIFESKDKERKNILLDTQQMSAIDEAGRDFVKVQNPLLRLEHALQPLCAFIIMPLFAFANAGVDIRAEVNFHIDHIMLGVIFGLVVGKPLGILSLTFLCEKCKIASRPAGVSWSHILGAGMLAGIGFTMSMFVSNLAFDAPQASDVSKIAILLASSIAGILGSLYLIINHKINSHTKVKS